MKTRTMSASRRWFTVTILAVAAASIAITVSAADRLSETLQKGLFEEEANHNLEAAIKAYEAVVEQSQEQRRIAATALFRLGECYRKQNKTNEAAGYYERLLRDYSDQTTLANLSRQNLSVFGPKKADGQPAAGEAATTQEAAVLQRIRAMIKGSPDLINAPSHSGAMPLHEAADAGQLSVAQFLVANGADVNGRDPSSATPLHYAALSGHKNVCKFLLENGADINAHGTHVRRIDFRDGTPLHLAIYNGYQGVTETLLQHKADPNAQDRSRKTPLHIAAARGHVAMAKLLIAHGANVNVPDTYETLPVHEAASRGHVAVVRALIESGTALDRRTKEAQLPIHLAILSGSPAANEMVRLLVEKGSDINARGKESKTPLHLAAERNAEDLLQTVLAFKPNLEIEDYASRTALEIAIVAAKSARATQLLLDAGANANRVHANWGTPLIAAIRTRQFDVAALLLERKADPNQPDKAGETPLAFARGQAANSRPQPGTEEVAVLARIEELLIKHGADQNHQRRKTISLFRESPWLFFTRDPAGHNQHTLYELIGYFYQQRNPYNSWSAYSFPDLSRLTIERLVEGGKGTNRIPVNLEKQVEDIPLEWGDFVIIPVRDHQLHETWHGLPAAITEELQRRPLRTVTLHVKDKATEVTLRPELKRNLGQSSGLPVTAVAGATVMHWPTLQYVVRHSGMLFASSDLTRVKVKRPEQSGKEARILIFNLENKLEDLWLQEGDIIEVPDKES